MRKILVTLLTWVAFCSLTAADSAMAAPWQDWFGWGKPKDSCAANVVSVPVRELLEQSQKDFAAYVELRKRAGTKLPATSAPIRQDTSLHEIFYGFSYWWVPGNAWHSLLMKEQPQLGLFMQTEAQQDGIQIPDISHKPEIDEPFTVPDSLP